MADTIRQDLQLSLCSALQTEKPSNALLGHYLILWGVDNGCNIEGVMADPFSTNKKGQYTGTTVVDLLRKVEAMVRPIKPQRGVFRIQMGTQPPARKTRGKK